MAEIQKNNSIQLDDIARELKLSTSTISRVISGKGNISEETRKRVKEYINQHNYSPNAIARSLATRKTNNIGVVIPGDAFLHVTPFFQVCLMGICEKAVKMDYDVVVTSATENDISYLRRLVGKQAVDGVVLMRSLVKDTSTEYLLSTGIPFVTIGSIDDGDVVQVDVKHREAACELTSRLIDTLGTSVGIVLGGMNYVVNLNRYRGFLDAFKEKQIRPVNGVEFTNLITQEEINVAVDNLIGRVNTIVCGDDNICLTVLKRLADKGLKVPTDIKVASLYNSVILSNRDVPVTAVEVDDKVLGAAAAASLIDMIENKKIDTKLKLGYTIAYRVSTQE